MVTYQQLRVEKLCGRRSWRSVPVKFGWHRNASIGAISAGETWVAASAQQPKYKQVGTVKGFISSCVMRFIGIK
jgi:hypothetical protein